MRALMPVDIKNGFNRKLNADKAILLHVIDRPKDVKAIVGWTGHHLYFKMSTPSSLWLTNYNLQEAREQTLRIPAHPGLASFTMMVDSPRVHIMAGNFPAVIIANLNNDSVRLHYLPGGVFTRAIALSEDSYIFRGYDSSQKNSGQLFIKRRLSVGEVIARDHIKRDEDDQVGIRSDGLLGYDKKTNLVSYVSFYRNQIYCMDTNLDLKYVGRTIDTVGSVAIKTARINQTETNKSPTRVINARSRVSGGKLYIESKLRADNETEEAAWGNAVIDVYAIETGAYEGSFYLPFYKREKIMDFRIIGSLAVVMYKNYLATYRL